MAVLLVDTGVASYLHPKKRYSPQRLLYGPDLLGHSLAISFQTAAELFMWAEANRWGAAQRHALDLFLGRFALIPYDGDLGRTWARVMTHARAAGRRLESGDGWIVATAVRHGLTLVTHDKDLVGLGLPGLSVVCHA
jgi:predicted nucleic acid-binding protein